MLPVVVLGAGLAGLATSYFLRRAGVPHRVLERSAEPGGHARTTEDTGYRFDRTGHLLHLRDEEIRDLVLSWFPEGHLLEIDRKSVVFSHGVYTRYPFQANVRGLPSEVAYACVRDFVNTKLRRTTMPIESFEDFSVAHFGEAISREFMIP
ncbi:MAG TPA: NAD(P)-binding protein, partial [Polyangiaceae bacterium]|nr:NAD(P)-binding protein [Polyangiaceae bacterium]